MGLERPGVEGAEGKTELYPRAMGALGRAERGAGSMAARHPPASQGAYSSTTGFQGVS